jgi:beta-galactosidase GanA
MSVVAVCTFAAAAALQTQPISAQASRTTGMPRLETRGAATQLIVDGKPFLALGGELNNSNGSSVEYMKTVWPRLVKMHLNTVIIPVSWELLEPEHGRYDFTLVDAMITAARANRMKIVFLWFGTWKNSMSCYVPEWMKKDTAAYPRACSAEGKPQEIVSPFSTAALDADRTAFTALMKHIKAVDAAAHTVLMMQVENEIGMLPNARDHSPLGAHAYAAQVPAELIGYLGAHEATLQPELVQAWKNSGRKNAGTWEEVFGPGIQTEEYFMAWVFAKYTNSVAEAGKKEYALPMFVNAALTKPGQTPGQYPSAGPLPHLIDIWKAGAPSIDMLSPDIYQKPFAAWIARFDSPGNPLFIPEVANSQSAANAFYAFAAHNAMGYSPYSIESLDRPEDNEMSQAYGMLHDLTPLILEGQTKGTLAGVLLDSAAQSAAITLGDYVFTVRHEYTWPYASRREGEVPRYGGMIIMLAPDEFYFAGTGLVTTFVPKNGPGRTAGIVRSDEGSFKKGAWVPVRRMNGDQTHQGRHINLPGSGFTMQRVKFYTY